MKGLPQKFFGPSGLPCVFSIDKLGNTSVGYIVKQLGTKSFLVTDGSASKFVRLAQTPIEVESYLSFLPPGIFTILVETFNGSIENVKNITEFKCATIQGNGYLWHNDSPVPGIAGIVTPSADPEILLESGDQWLLESGDQWLLE
jgi:hypothetical protein